MKSGWGLLLEKVKRVDVRQTWELLALRDSLLKIIRLGIERERGVTQKIASFHGLLCISRISSNAFI